MAHKRDKKNNLKPTQRHESTEFTPLAEESTDYRAPGEKFELLGEGENFDRNRMDQPRRNLESLPKAHKDKEAASKRHPSFEEEHRKREQKKKRVA
jgi:hypothetical protein